MIDNSKKEKFIELRARGMSFNAISQELEVSKPTLIEWSKELAIAISNLKAMELEDLQERYFIQKKKRIELFGSQVEAIKNELATRDLKQLPTSKLFDLLGKFALILKSEETPVKFSNKSDTMLIDLDDALIKSWEA